MVCVEGAEAQYDASVRIIGTLINTDEHRFLSVFICALQGEQMVNPIAIVMMVLGALLLALGIFLVRKHRRMLGTIISFLGLAAIATPFVVTYLMPNP